MHASLALFKRGQYHRIEGRQVIGRGHHGEAVEVFAGSLRRDDADEFNQKITSRKHGDVAQLADAGERHAPPAGFGAARIESGILVTRPAEKPKESERNWAVSRVFSVKPLGVK